LNIANQMDALHSHALQGCNEYNQQGDGNHFHFGGYVPKNGVAIFLAHAFLGVILKDVPLLVIAW